MIKLAILLPFIIGGAGVWAILNGLVHLTLILRRHDGKYDRELFRLLMIGHILIFSGIIQVISFWILFHFESGGYVLAAISSISIIILSMLGSAFLKSVGIMAIEIMVLLLVILKMLFPAL